MNHIYRFLLLVFLFVLCHSCHRFNKITHLSDEELEWVTNRHQGETMYFQSQAGVVDTLIVTKIDIQNSTDSIDWNYCTTSSGVYHASGDVYFYLRGREGRDGFNLYKDTNDIICFWMEFLDILIIDRAPLVDTCIQIDSMVLDDVLFFGENYCEMINRYHIPNPISSLAWSKQYGLVQYTFQDGTEFNRIDLE